MLRFGTVHRESLFSVMGAAVFSLQKAITQALDETEPISKGLKISENNDIHWLNSLIDWLKSNQMLKMSSEESLTTLHLTYPQPCPQ